MAAPMYREISTLLADSKPVADEVRNANFNPATDLHVIGGELVFFAGQVLVCLIKFPTCVNPPLNSRPRLFLRFATRFFFTP